ncbi:NUDIX domain-containing protein [Sphingobacterium sp. N143]|nr:NUDIX domain-containing protein [Sphingobacterium sp. N143]
MMVSMDGELLMVRKKGSLYFQLPGGKMAIGEEQEETLARELKEELQLDVSNIDLQFIGKHITEAVNEPDTLVEGNIYLIRLKEKYAFIPYEELEEVQWINKANWRNYKLAHLAAEFVVPKWLADTFDV